MGKLNESSFPRNKAYDVETFRKIPKTFLDHYCIYTLPDKTVTNQFYPNDFHIISKLLFQLCLANADTFP